MLAEGTRIGHKENAIETENNNVQMEDIAVANMHLDGIGDVLENENITMAESSRDRPEFYEKEEVRDEQNVNEGLHVASQQGSPRVQKHSCVSYQYCPPSPVEQLNFFSVLPMGNVYYTRARPGLRRFDGPRSGPGRRYDTHFTLG